MKYKNIFKCISYLLISLFLFTYVQASTGYYKYKENNKVALTEEAIKRFENDMLNKKPIKASNYLIKEKNYNNKITIIFMKASNKIENIFDKFLKLIFKKIESIVNE